MLLIATGLIGCAPEAPPAAPRDLVGTPAASTLPTANQVNPAESSTERVTITFAALGEERPRYQPLIETFEKNNPDIHVQFVELEGLIKPTRMPDGGMIMSPYSSMREIVGSADTAAAAVTGEAIQNGWVRDLTPLMDADPAFNRDDFYPGTLEAAKRGEKTFMLPRAQYVALLAYNKGLWAASGLPTPRSGWTWTDVKAAAEQLVRKRGSMIEVYGLAEWNAGERVLRSELAAAGIDLSATPVDRLRLDNQAIEDAVERVAAMARSGALYVPPDGSRYDAEANAKLIRSQRVGIWMSGMDFLDRSTPAFEIGLATSPFESVFVDGYVMSSGTQHPEQAWRWLSFLSHQAGGASSGLGNMGAEVPARRSVAMQSGYWERLDAEARAAIQAMLDRPTRASPRSRGDEQDQVIHLLIQALNAIMSTGQPSRQALSNAQAALDQYIAQRQLTAQPNADSGPIAVATPLPQPTPGAVTVSFGAPSFIANQLGEAARAFNQANPTIFVNIVPSDTPTAPGSLAEVANSFDCFAWPEAPRDDEFAALLDLQPLIDADATFPRADYPPVLLQPFKKAGGQYGLPSMVFFRALHYDVATFDAAGVAHPTADWTPDDFLHAAQQLTHGTGGTKQYGFGGYGAQTGEIFFFLDRLGAVPATGSGDTIKLRFTDPLVVQAIRGYLELLRTASPNTRLQGYRRNDVRDDSYELIAAGRIGMWFAFDTGFLDRGPAEKPSFDWAIAPPPLGKSGVTANDVRVRGMYISAHSQRVEACWSWLTYLSSDLTGVQGGFPARTSLATSDVFFNQAPPGAGEVYPAYLAAFEHSHGSDAPTERFSRQAIDYYWLFRAIDRAMQGGDLERELADAQTLTEQYLACVRGGATAGVCATQVDPDYQGFARP